jgi:hypothetical protein
LKAQGRKLEEQLSTKLEEYILLQQQSANGNTSNVEQYYSHHKLDSDDPEDDQRPLLLSRQNEQLSLDIQYLLEKLKEVTDQMSDVADKDRSAGREQKMHNVKRMTAILQDHRQQFSRTRVRLCDQFRFRF